MRRLRGFIWLVFADLWRLQQKHVETIANDSNDEAGLTVGFEPRTHERQRLMICQSGLLVHVGFIDVPLSGCIPCTCHSRLCSVQTSNMVSAAKWSRARSRHRNIARRCCAEGFEGFGHVQLGLLQRWSQLIAQAA